MIYIKTIRVNASVAGGTQDFTSTGFGTPKAAIFMVTKATADNTETADNIISVGATCGGAQWVNGYGDIDNVADVDSYRYFFNSKVIYLRTSASIYADASFNSFITDGVRITWNANAAAAYKITVILFGGSGVSAKCGVTTYNSTTGVDINTVGFQPDAVLCCGNTVDNNTAEDGSPSFSIGWALRAAGTNKCIAWRTKDGSSTGYTVGYASDNKCVASIGSGDSLRTATIGSFDIDGFTITGSTTSSTAIGYLALKFANASVWSGFKTTPTSNGDWDNTDPGFKPQAGVFFLSRVASLSDSSIDTNQTGDTFALGATDGTDQFTQQNLSEDGAATTNAWSRINTGKIADAYQENGSTSLFSASLSSFLSNGYRLNVSSQDGVAHQLLGFVVQENVSVAVHDFGYFMSS